MASNKVSETQTGLSMNDNYNVQSVVAISYGRTVFVVLGGGAVANQNRDASLVSKAAVLRGGSLIVVASALLALVGMSRLDR